MTILRISAVARNGVYSSRGQSSVGRNAQFFSERELMFMFAICRRPSVRLSVCRLSVCL